MFNKLMSYFSNFYILTGLIFLLWIGFMDADNLISRFHLGTRLSALEEEKKYYKEKIIEVKVDRNELTTNKELLEKFARERYLMKKDNEDIFFIESKNSD